MSRTLLKLSILLISSALSIALLELGFRAYESRFLIHELEPDAPFYDLRSLRYNDHEGFVGSSKPEGELRILSFGDSFAESVTVPERTYASVLQRNLSSAAAGRRVRVVNFGRSGTSFPGYASQHEVWSRQLEHDAVLFNLYSGNDFFDLRGVVFVESEAGGHREWHGGEAPMRYGPGLAIPREFPLRFLDYAYASFYSGLYSLMGNVPDAGPGAEDAGLYRKRALQYPDDVYLATQTRQVSVFRPDMMETYFDAYFWLYKLLVIARQVEERGLPVAITMAPPHFVVDRAWGEVVLENADTERENFEPDLPAMVVQALAREVGFEGPVLDLTDCLRRTVEQGGAPYWGTNTHWSVQGNRVVGEVLSEELAARWLDGVAPSDARAKLGCSTAVAPASPAVEQRIAEAIPVIRDLLRFEETTQAALLGRRFADRDEVSRALIEVGYREEAKTIVGSLDGFASKPGDRILRPHGLRRFVRPQGWAVDRARPGEPLFVVLLHGGRVAGIARTREAADAGLQERADLPLGTPNVRFHTVMKRVASGAAGASDLWVVALSPDRSFAWLQ